MTFKISNIDQHVGSSAAIAARTHIFHEKAPCRTLHENTLRVAFYFSVLEFGISGFGIYLGFGILGFGISRLLPPPAGPRSSS
jgi:hypothetical protein